MTEPVTLGDLRVKLYPATKATRPATVADLVSALRAEGVLLMERVDDRPSILVFIALDALAEAQP